MPVHKQGGIGPRGPPPTHPVFCDFFAVFLTPDNEHLCSETDFTQDKGNFLDDHLLEAGPSGWSMVICNYEKDIKMHF